jgi:hypothetical protein
VVYIECCEYRPLTEYPGDYDYFEHAEVSQEDNGCAMAIMCYNEYCFKKSPRHDLRWAGGKINLSTY